MPIFDFSCSCGFEWNDHYVAHHRVRVPCPHCDASDMAVTWKPGGFPAVQDDTYLGGLTVENLAATPITFASRSEHRAYLKAHGFSPKVQHKGTPGEGSDKSAHTSRWV